MMTNCMPELGSRISLISKADIRYEGRLFTVDPQECTIALAGVQSFGTEDRETQYPIAPQSQIYEYILFRGSDIKDIRVINNCSIPNDPAIMQMHLPSSQGMMPGGPGFQGPGFNVPNNMPHMGGNGPPPMGNFAPFNPMSGFPGMSNSNVGMSNIGDASKKNKHSNENIAPNTSSAANNADKHGDPKSGISGISRSITPVSLGSRKSPTTDMGVQTNRDKGDKGNRDGNKKPQQSYQRHPQQGNQQRQYDNNQGFHSDYRFQNRNHRQQQHGGWNNRGPMQMNNRMRFRGRPPQGNFGNRQGNNRGKNVLKFESDYDFEQANNKFEELRLQLSKLKVGEEAKAQQPNGDVTEKKEDSGNETGVGEHEPDEEDVGYDKTKSFFDNISCEAMERSKGKTQRTDWRQERKLNSETFGVSHNRRGNFRSRGGGYFSRNTGNFHNRMNNRDDYRGRNNDNRQQGGSGQPQQQQPQQQQQRPQAAAASKK